MHKVIEPKILYFGTPVVLISTLNEDGSPAAGVFEGWPTMVKQLRVLDPCMGSGHFPVFAQRSAE